jgi:hypothetical protein
MILSLLNSMNMEISMILFLLSVQAYWIEM